MDALWQENKRWILGVVLGVLVYWIGTGVIGGAWDSRPVTAKIRAAETALRANAFYGDAALAAARAERDALAAARDRLAQTLVFTPAPEFTLEGKGMPDMHFDEVRRRVRRDLLTRAEALGVDLAGKDLLQWTPQRDEFESALLALNLVEEAGRRLLDAHQAVVEANPDALGLVAIESLRFDTGRARGAPRPARRAAGDAAEVALTEVPVRFKLLLDEATLLHFLELCRAQQPPIALAADFSVSAPRAPGEPLEASGTLAAIRLPEEP